MRKKTDWRKLYKHTQETAKEWRDYALDLEAQRDRLLEDLKSLACGYVDSTTPENYTWKDRMQLTAACKLQREARRNRIAKPWRAP